MRPSTDLFDLVKSMTPSEKRHFRLSSGRDKQNRSRNYLRLFDLLSSSDLKEYDEPGIKAHFKGEPCLNQFTRSKSYLYQRIIRTLRQFHAGKSIRRRCLALLDTSELLLERQLFSQALQHIHRCKALVIHYALTDLLPGVLIWERRLLKIKEGKGQEEALSTLEQEENDAIASWQQEQKLHAIYDKFWLISKQRRDMAVIEGGEIEKLRSHPLFDLKPEELTFGGVLAQTLSLAIYHRLRGEMQKSFLHYKNAVLHWEGQPQMVRSFTDRYLRAVVAFLYSCHAIGEYTEFTNLLTRLQADTSIRGIDIARISAMRYNLQLLYSLNQAPLTAGQRLATELANELKKETIPLSTWIPSVVNLSIFLFLKEDIPGAKRWLSQLLDLPRGKEWTDLRELARLLWLLVLYETGEYQLLGYACRSMVRFVQYRRPLNALEKEAKRFFNRVNKNPDFVERLNGLRIWKEAFSDGTMREIMGGEIFQIWVEARLRNLSMEKVHGLQLAL